MKKFYDRVREMNELMELQRQAYNDYYFGESEKAATR